MRAADGADFAAFVAASSRRLLRGAYLITGDVADAEDLLQTALERAYRRWPTIRRMEAPEAYVRRIVVTSAINASRRRRVHGGGPFTSTGSAVWVVTGGATTEGYSGPLVRLNGDLRPTTPAAVQRSPLLSNAANVWSHGDTIWVSLGPSTWTAGRSLVCFTAGSRIGRIAALPIRGSVLALAATRYTVYVSTVPAGRYGALSTGVTGYRVPAACR
jgi:Sigma-70 region 2